MRFSPHPKKKKGFPLQSGLLIFCSFHEGKEQKEKNRFPLFYPISF